MRKYLLLALTWFVLLLSCRDNDDLTVRSGAPQVTSLPPIPTLNANAVSLGQRVYDEHCAACHGVSLEGEPQWQSQNVDRSFRAPPHDASGHTWHHSDADLIEAVKRGGARLPDNIGGTSHMPAYAGILTEEEIAAVLAFIKSSWPEDLRQIQWEQTLRSQP